MNISKISIIVPAYNEEKTIIPLLESVQQTVNELSTVAIEVIVVNDSSTDNTGTLLNENTALYDHLISTRHQSGKGGAILEGLKQSTGDYILFQDADLEYSPKEFEKLFKPILEFEADVVIGSRFLAPEWTRVHYFWHMIGNRCLTFVFNLLNNTTFTDVYSCYLLYRKALFSVGDITTSGWEQHGEILSLAVKNGKVFYEVPISYYGRTYNEGKKIRSVHIWKILYILLVTRFKPSNNI